MAGSNKGWVDEGVQRWRWFFGSRVGPNGLIAHGRGQRRKWQRARIRTLAAPAGPAGSLNWTPLGPSVVQHGQASGYPATTGRITAVAVGPNASRIYAGTANGGVWFSGNGGIAWQPLDDYVMSPSRGLGRQADALSVGALAVEFGSAAATDMVFVGTGEPQPGNINPDHPFDNDGYFGIGIRVSPSGGAPDTWTLEAEDLLRGHAIFRIALDPDDPARAFAGTTRGLYVRSPKGKKATWIHLTEAFVNANGPASDLVITGRGDQKQYFVAFWGDGVYRSSDGVKWTAVNGMNATGRIALAAAESDPSVVYALASDGRLHRLVSGSFQPVAGVPRALFANGQGDYDIALAVDPADPDTLFLAGDLTWEGPSEQDGEWNLSFYKGRLIAGPGGYSFPFRPENDIPSDPELSLAGKLLKVARDGTWIGDGIHPDVHALAFAHKSGGGHDGSNIWVGCDGGLFQSAQGGKRGTFEPRNLGLAIVECTFLAQRPDTDAVVFSGCQDSGTVSCWGGPAWQETDLGDGGGVVVDPNRPHQVMHQYVNAQLFVCANAAPGAAWTQLVFPPSTDYPADPPATAIQFEAAKAENQMTGFYAPLAAIAVDQETTRAVFGTHRLWLTEDWGQNWVTLPTGANPYTANDPAQPGPRKDVDAILQPDQLDGTAVTAFAFASPTLIFAATRGTPTTSSTIWRFEKTGAGWSRAPIASPQPQSATGARAVASITAIAVEEATNGSFYVTLGGGGPDHVWYYNGKTERWKSAGLRAAKLDVPAHAIVVDPEQPQNVYVGTDLGCWRGIKTDARWSWEPFSQGLPEAAITDLAIHARTRLLRAATHGRGVWEIPIATGVTISPEPDIYLRINAADSGRLMNGVRPSWLDGAVDPTNPAAKVYPWMSPDIKVRRGSLSDLPNLIDQPDFLDFAFRVADQVQDGLQLADASGPNLVLIQVHNRGQFGVLGTQVRLVLLLADAEGGPPPLPEGYADRLYTGDASNWVDGTHWHFASHSMPYRFLLDRLDVRTPQVVSYEVDFTALALPPGHDQVFAAVLVTTTTAADRLTATTTDLAQLVMHDKHVAYRKLRLVPPAR